MDKRSHNIIAVAVIVLVYLFCILGCSNDLPTEQQFKNWISIIYTYETGLKADRIYIDLWERTSKDVYKKFPGLDGWEVEAMIVTFPIEEELASDLERLDKTTFHYVICDYFKFNDKWRLSASSWGDGLWKEVPNKWEYRKCVREVETFKNEFRDELMKKN